MNERRAAARVAEQRTHDVGPREVLGLRQPGGGIQRKKRAHCRLQIDPCALCETEQLGGRRMPSLMFPAVDHIGTEVQPSTQRRLRVFASQATHQFGHNPRKIEFGHMSRSHTEPRRRTMVCASPTLPHAAPTVKSTVMDQRIAAVLLVSAVFGGAGVGCGDGGQTYDDGSDGLDGNRPDAGMSVAPARPESSTNAGETSADANSDELCSGLALQAAASLEELRAGADTACSVDEDCLAALLPFATCTHANHCGYQPLSVSGLARLEDDIELMNGGVCAEFEASGCELGPSWYTPCPAAMPKQAWCDAGTCAVRDVPTCEEAFPDAWDAMADVYFAANRECSNDAECVLFTSSGVSCTPGFASRCDAETALNRDAIAFIDTALDLVEAEHCFGYEPDSCSAAIDPIACPEGRVARCVDAVCAPMED